jgi:transcriptional regulator with XRE-family HTH domain
MLALSPRTTMPKMPTAIGTLIANERRRLGWSLRDIAAHAEGKIRHNTIGYVEDGTTKNPDSETLWQIATALAAGSAKMDKEPVEAREWFARLLRAAGRSVNDEADEVLAQILSVLPEDKRQQLREMTAEDLITVLDLWRRARGK